MTAPTLVARHHEVRPARSRPVLWWAGLGVVAIVCQIYVYTAWILSDDFKSTPTGPDPVPQWEKVCAWILQPALALIALAALVWVIRGCRRAGRVTLDAKLLIAGYCQLWLDPIGSLIRPQFFFNSYYINHGSWLGQIPFAMTPDAHLLADLPFLEGAVYGSMIFVCVAGCAFMRALRRRRPQISNVALVLSTWLAVGVFMFAFEALFVMRAGAAVWLAPVPELTLFYDTRWQVCVFPDPAFWSIFWVTMISIRFYVNDRGEPRSDAGINDVNVSGRTKTVFSTLGVVGAVTASMIVASALAIFASLYSTTPPDLPSYLRDGMCGTSTQYECPDRGVPIQTADR